MRGLRGNSLKGVYMGIRVEIISGSIIGLIRGGYWEVGLRFTWGFKGTGWRQYC